MLINAVAENRMVSLRENWERLIFKASVMGAKKMLLEELQKPRPKNMVKKQIIRVMYKFFLLLLGITIHLTNAFFN
jgi:hypothetical protein